MLLPVRAAAGASLSSSVITTFSGSSVLCARSIGAGSSSSTASSASIGRSSSAKSPGKFNRADCRVESREIGDSSPIIKMSGLRDSAVTTSMRFVLAAAVAILLVRCNCAAAASEKIWIGECHRGWYCVLVGSFFWLGGCHCFSVFDFVFCGSRGW